MCAEHEKDFKAGVFFKICSKVKPKPFFFENYYHSTLIEDFHLKPSQVKNKSIKFICCHSGADQSKMFRH